MILYIAGGETTCALKNPIMRNFRTKHKLETLNSYYTLMKCLGEFPNHRLNFVLYDMKTPSRILDSGAYSAWFLQTSVDFNKYIAFAKELDSIFDYIVNLDVIPAKFGAKKVTRLQVEKSAFKGILNFRKMIKQGIPRKKIIHVYHQGEDIKWLKRMINFYQRWKERPKKRETRPGFWVGGGHHPERYRYWFQPGPAGILV